MKISFAAWLLVAAGAVHAQPASYSGQQLHDIKALSAQEIEQYRAGAGMGYAKAAELNHFPGPMHVLELAGPLALTSEQRAATERLKRYDALRGHHHRH